MYSLYINLYVYNYIPLSVVALLANLSLFPFFRKPFSRATHLTSRMIEVPALSILSTFRPNGSTQLSSLPMFISASLLSIPALFRIIFFFFFTIRDFCSRWTHVFVSQITCFFFYFFLDEGTEGRRWTRPLLTSPIYDNAVPPARARCPNKLAA